MNDTVTLKNCPVYIVLNALADHEILSEEAIEKLAEIITDSFEEVDMGMLHDFLEESIELENETELREACCKNFTDSLETLRDSYFFEELNNGHFLKLGL